MAKDTYSLCPCTVKNLILPKISNIPTLMNLELPPTWSHLLSNELSSPQFAILSDRVNSAYASSVCYPPKALIFEAFKLCSPENVKVVIIGQDPYHGAGQAHGLSFSVPAGQKLPPSLKNIFKELQNDKVEFEVPLSGDLSHWAEQGVLLLNAVLTVEAGKPGSHKLFNWEWFTDRVLEKLSDSKQNLVFMLWGNYARSKSSLINADKHLILEAAHPSPLARGAFFGCQAFSQCNTYLQQHGIAEIKW